MEPFAYAQIVGNRTNPQLRGVAYFYPSPKEGLWVEVEVYGLPVNPSDFYGMHIHEIGNCTKPFDQTGSHYNPNETLHPEHAGDLPPLLGNDGYAYICFFTNRLTTTDIIGRSIIIHSSADDFTTQPAGNSGEKIACGVIEAYTNSTKKDTSENK